MTYPTGGPATLAAVKLYLSIAEDDTTDDSFIEPIVAAVNTKVLSWPVAGVADDAADWEGAEVAHIVQGANMLAARLVRRRNSPDGVAAFTAAGPVYVSRNDPDVALLLNLGAYKRPIAR